MRSCSWQMSERNGCQKNLRMGTLSDEHRRPALFCNCDACRRALALGGKNIRTRSQVLIDNSLLVDFPPDSYLHMPFQGLSLKTIEHLIVTHSHQDHFYPLDFILKGEPYAHIDSSQPQLKIYGNHETRKLYDLGCADNNTNFILLHKKSDSSLRYCPKNIIICICKTEKMQLSILCRIFCRLRRQDQGQYKHGHLTFHQEQHSKPEHQDAPHSRLLAPQEQQ